MKHKTENEKEEVLVLPKKIYKCLSCMYITKCEIIGQ